MLEKIFKKDNSPKTNNEKRFVEVIDISPNHTFVMGTIRKGKTNERLKQLLNEEVSTLPEPLIGDRVISDNELLTFEQVLDYEPNTLNRNKKNPCSD